MGWGHVEVRRIVCWSQAKSLAEEEGLLSLSSLVGHLYGDCDNFFGVVGWGHVVISVAWLAVAKLLGGGGTLPPSLPGHVMASQVLRWMDRTSVCF